MRFSHAVIDAGADLVIGQGPHVPRAVELYRGHLIAYSLGNFWTYTGVKNYAVSGLGAGAGGMACAGWQIAGFTIHSAGRQDSACRIWIPCRRPNATCSI